eukprot:9388039-Pyramimonas_sp.AAC.1
MAVRLSGSTCGWKKRWQLSTSAVLRSCSMEPRDLLRIPSAADTRMIFSPMCTSSNHHSSGKYDV